MMSMLRRVVSPRSASALKHPLAAITLGCLIAGNSAAIACEIGLRVEERTPSGSIFVLSDHTVWFVESSYLSTTRSWYPHNTSVTACDSEGALIKVDGSITEKVKATKVYPR